MARFFYASGTADPAELTDLLLRRYHTLDFSGMELDEFLDLLQYARKKERDEELRQQWLAMLPNLNKYMSYAEFHDLLTGASIDMRPAQVIIDEIMALHGLKEGEDEDGT